MLFISHASADEAMAVRLQQALSARGVTSVFLDVDPALGIVAGQAWQAVLYRRLRACHALVALVTDHLLASRWCFAEIALARMQGKHLFSFRADPLAADAVVPDLLSDRQQVDGRPDFDAAVERLLIGLDQAGLRSLGARAWDRQRSPFPGLMAFDEADAGVFFGRDAEQQRALEAVQGACRGTAARCVLLLGASGSGKSSLLRAGLLPRLRQQPGLLLAGPVRPRGQPMEELAFHLSSSLKTDEDALLQRLVTAAAEPVADAALERIVARHLRRAGADGTLCILIDQFEELLGRPPGHASHQVLRLLRGALQASEGRIVVLATLRSDHLGAWQAHEQALGLEWQAVSVPPMGLLQLRSVIEEPASLAELELVPGLVERLVADTASAQALPLLSMTLQRLWDRHGSSGRWELAHYEALGCVQAAVAREAEAALGPAPDAAALAELRQALLALVRLDEQGRASRQACAWADVSPAARPWLDNFVRRRLLVRDEATVEVAHEGLFSAWQRLADWIAQDREALLVRQQLAQAATGWMASQDESELWRGTRLARLLELLGDPSLEAGAAAALPPASQAFLQASVALRERQRADDDRARQERDRLTRTALGRGLAYQALGEARDRPQRGLLLAAAAAEATMAAGLGATDAAENALRELLSQVGGRSLGSAGQRIRCMAVSADGAHVAVGTEDGRLMVADLQQPEPADGAPARCWPAHAQAVRSLGWQGATLISHGAEGQVLAWGLEGAAQPLRTLAGAGRQVHLLAIGPGTGRVAMAVAGEGLCLVDTATGSQPLLCDDSYRTRVLAFSGDERWLAQGLEDGRVLLWSLDPAQPVVTAFSVATHAGAVTRIAWARDARCLVTWGEDRALRRWHFEASPAEISQQDLSGATSAVQAVAVSEDGRQIVAGLGEPRALVWTAEDAFNRPAVLQGHPSTVDSVALSAGGQWILTASSRDNTVLLWPAAGLQDEPQAIKLRGEDRWITALAVAPQGFILAASWDGSVRRWHRVVEEPASVAIDGVDLNRVALTSDGSALLAAGATMAFGGEPDRRCKRVDLSSETVSVIHEPAEGVAVAMTPDGRVEVIGSADGQLHVRRPREGTVQRLSFPIEGWFGRLALDRSGRWLVASGSSSATLGPALFDLHEDGRMQTLAPPGAVLQCAAFDRTGQWLLTVVDSRIVALWRHEAGSFALQRQHEHEGARWCAFCPDSARWVSGGPDGLQVHTVIEAVDVLHLPAPEVADSPHFAMAESADVVAMHGAVQAWVWRLAEPGARIELPRHEGYLLSLAVSPDGQRVATAMVDGGVRLWTLDQPGSPLPFPHSRSGSLLLRFLDDGRRLLVGDSGQSLATWDLDVTRLIARARQVAGRELDPEERVRFLGS